MIREVIRKEGMVALGRVVFTSREHVIALEPRRKGLLGITLRFSIAGRGRMPARPRLPAAVAISPGGMTAPGRSPAADHSHFGLVPA